MKSERGIEREFPEAVLQHLTHLMICNFVVDNVPNPAQTDIQFMDRMTDSYGNHYRVIAPIDDAGIHHHLLVALETWSPSATGDV
jgi:phage portal protein BeeE